MRKWECVVCGLVYDEAKGWPGDGIAPGTRWEDVPESWLCPDCGVGKEDFELLADATADSDSSSAEAGMEPQAPIVIIGTGLAGYGLAREFRKHDGETPLILITQDDGRAYSKPMLSTGYTKNTDAEALTQNDSRTMATTLNAAVWTRSKVLAVNTKEKHAVVSTAGTDGEAPTTRQLGYSALVFATGAQIIQPPLEGNALEQVYSVNDLEDYAAFRTAVIERKVRRIAIIGAGLIGCEFANDFLNGGFEVDVIDPLNTCLPTLLPERCGRAVHSALVDKGARFHFGPLVKAVNYPKDGSKDSVVLSLSDNGSLVADIVVSAIGVRPRTDLAAASGIEVKRGIVVDRHLRTSAPDVFALGDCAEVDGHVLVYVAPLMAAARALGKTLSGTATEVTYPAMPVVIKTPACPTVVAPPPPDSEGDWEFAIDGNNTRAEFRDSTGALLGFALTGEACRDKMNLQKLLPPILA